MGLKPRAMGPRNKSGGDDKGLRHPAISRHRLDAKWRLGPKVGPTTSEGSIAILDQHLTPPSWESGDAGEE
jgi:hypothetical protein